MVVGFVSVLFFSDTVGSVREKTSSTMRRAWEAHMLKHVSNTTSSGYRSVPLLEEVQRKYDCCGFDGREDMAVGACYAGQSNATRGCSAFVMDSVHDAMLPIVLLLSATVVLQVGVIAAGLSRRKDIVRNLSHKTHYLLMKYANASAEEVQAAVRIQRYFRIKVARTELLRRREFEAWLSMRKERGIILFLLYTVVVLYTLFATYICLLYGVYFDEPTAKRWVLSSLLAMGIDLIVQQPLVILLKSMGLSVFSTLFGTLDLTNGL